MVLPVVVPPYLVLVGRVCAWDRVCVQYRRVRLSGVLYGACWRGGVCVGVALGVGERQRAGLA